MLPKGHLGCPRGTRPPSSIVESSTRPVFDHHGKETLRVYPWMCCMLLKGHVAYPGGPWLLLSIVEPSTFTVFVALRKELSKSAPRCTACSLRIIQIVRENLGRYFQNLSATRLAASVTQSFSFTCLSPLHARGV